MGSYDNYTYGSDEIIYTTIPMSIQYIIVSTYVIITWGKYDFPSNVAKSMLMYLYLFS